ncbi:hypothetical protein [Paenibacillus sp. DMB5]|uniref:hypothetical protein n=1 Tax=Paenibacillus sp. DMB5 TaxID=1780103 RepID=UPI00076D8371|nr:hypothetical protein [Paenibacillus sp. DMB5]KUP20889.1 hypothetical protein AWJ19_06380 [Paenibacillus sp. DMB5]
MGTVEFVFKDGTVIESEYDDDNINECLDELLRLTEGDEIIRIRQPNGKVIKYTIDYSKLENVCLKENEKNHS